MSSMAHGSGTVVSCFGLWLHQRALLLGRRRLHVAVALSFRFVGQWRASVPLLTSGPTRQPCRALG